MENQTKLDIGRLKVILGILASSETIEKKRVELCWPSLAVPDMYALLQLYAVKLETEKKKTDRLQRQVNELSKEVEDIRETMMGVAVPGAVEIVEIIDSDSWMMDLLADTPGPSTPNTDADV